MTATDPHMSSPATPETAEGGGVDAVIAGLARPRAAIEEAFLRIGARLMDCAEKLNGIAALFRALPNQLESAEVAEATERLAAIGRRAREIEAAFAAEEEIMARLAEAVGKADYPISSLTREAKTMSIVAINARVVAAGVVGDSADFDVFTKDIARFSGSASATIAEFSETYRRLRAVIAEAAAARRAFSDRHRHTLTGLAEGLDSSLEAVTAQRRRSIEDSAATEQASRLIAQRVGAIVVALQVGDTTRQRLEHIEAALGTLRDSAGTSLVMALSERQLAATTDGFDREVGDADQQLQALAREAGEAIRHSLELYGRSGSGDSALGALNGEIRRTTALLHACEAERAKLDAVAASVSDTVRVLLAHVEAVQDIEANMRLVSLNAAVKCAQLGPRGRALDVISQQLRTLTGETVETAHQAVDCLNRAAQLTQGFSDTATSVAAGQMGTLEREAAAALAALEAVDSRFGDALATLGSDGPRVVAALGEAVDVLSGHAELSESLRDVHWQLASLAGAAGDVDADGPGEDSLATLAALRARYTMEDERRLHDAFVAEHLPDAAAPSAVAGPDTGGGDDALDDLLF